MKLRLLCAALLVAFGLTWAPGAWAQNVLAGNLTIDGTTLNSAATVILVGGGGSSDWQVTGDGGAVLTPEFSDDGSAWSASKVAPSGSTTAQATITADGTYAQPVFRHAQMRLRVSTAGSGAIAIHYIVSASSQDPFGQQNGQPITLPTTLPPVTLGTTNGWTSIDLHGLTTTVKPIKSAAGQLGMLLCYNPNATEVFVQLFNVVAGSVVLGTTPPTPPIPIGPSMSGGWVLNNPGMNFSTAISAAATTTATGLTAPSSAVDCVAAWN